MASYDKDTLSRQFLSLRMSPSLNQSQSQRDPENTLVGILKHILGETKVPISLSYLNVIFKSLGLNWMISENTFLKNRSVFALSIIGNDFKLSLRRPNETYERTDDGANLIGIINRDLTLISRLQANLQNPMPFDDFCDKYNSNKYKVNLAFIIRNSHALRLTLMDRTTYVKAQSRDFSSDIKEDVIWDSLQKDGFKTIFVTCLKGLLESFFEPVPLGNLQSCFNFGGLVIDKSFLRVYSDTFQGDGTRGITLNKNTRNAQVTLSNLSKSNPVPTQPNPLPTQSNPHNEAPESKRLSKSDLRKAFIELSLQQDTSVVVLGSSSQRPLIVETLGINVDVRLKSLIFLRDFLNKEIESMNENF